MAITEDYVSFETAKLLKEKGFNPINCGMYYSITTGKRTTELLTSLVSCPTLQMAMKWLREVHNLFIDTYYDCDFGEGYKFSVHKLPKGTTLESHNESYSTYEQACEAAIKYCIEHLI